MGLVLLGEYKDILEIEGSDEDDFIELTQYEVEQRIKNFLMRDIEATDYIEKYNGTGKNFLVLSQFPINSVSKLEIYEGLDSNGDEIWTEQVQGTDYDRLIIPTTKETVFLDGNVFSKGIQNIRITYNAGYTIIPNDIQQACKKLMVIYYGQVRKMRSLGINSVTQSNGASGTISFDKDEEDRILKSIEYYQAVVV